MSGHFVLVRNWARKSPTVSSVSFFLQYLKDLKFYHLRNEDTTTTPFYSHNKQFSYICHVTVRDTLQYQMVSSEGKKA